MLAAAKRIGQPEEKGGSQRSGKPKIDGSPGARIGQR